MCCFMFTETIGLLGMGAQDGHLDFHTAPKLWNYTCKLVWYQQGMISSAYKKIVNHGKVMKL